jgi:D-sedoheptulose 7-phosphate isomerase
MIPPAEEIRAGLAELEQLVAGVRAELSEEVARVAERIRTTLRSGGTLFFCGNGGSAADAQHLAAEYVVRFRRERRGLPAVALTTDTSILTAAANDLGFRDVFARQVEALAGPGDLLVLHSTSGESENLLRAAEVARELSVATVAFLARGGGRLRDRVDLAVVVPTDSTARAQELHLALGHLVCAAVEGEVAGEEDAGAGSGGHGAEGEGAREGMSGAEPGDRRGTEDDVDADSRETDRSRVLEVLEDSRVREKGQTLYYRMLAAQAVEEGRDDEAERLNELHADEQHHLSRLTARVLELGGRPSDLRPPAPEADLGGWEDRAREREAREVRWYEAILERELDQETRRVVREILDSELHHRDELRGKWMSA